MGVCVCFLDCVSAVVCMCVRKYLMKTELLYQSKRGEKQLPIGWSCLLDTLALNGKIWKIFQHCAFQNKGNIFNNLYTFILI